MEEISLELSHEGAFLEKVEKLKKKADIKLSDRKVETRSYEYSDWQGNRRFKRIKEVTYNVDFPELYIIDGYEYLGGLTNSDGMITWFAKDENTDLHDKVDENIIFKCHHCNKTIRSRKNRLFFKRENGEIVSFGVKCAENYFGFDVFTKLKRASIAWGNLFGEGGYGGVYYDTEHIHDKYMDFCLNWFGRNNGFVSQKKAEEYGKSSTTTNLFYYCPPHGKLKPEERAEIDDFWDTNPLSEKEMDDMKAKIYDFYEKREVESDFDRNLKNLFEMKGSKAGLLVYGVFNYFKEKELLEAKEKKFVSEWFEGEEVENLKVVYKSIRWFETAYGAQAIVTLESDKHTFKWFTSSGLLERFEEGNEYIMTKATVKKRDEYKGWKSTVIKTRFNWLLTPEDFEKKQKGKKKKGVSK